MRKIKIIDLLNKIANGEEVPKKVRYNKKNYMYVGENKDPLKYVGEQEFLMLLVDDLNEEVEILVEYEEIEEDLEKVLNTVLKAFERNDCIDWNFTDIREKYGLDNEEDEE